MTHDDEVGASPEPWSRGCLWALLVLAGVVTMFLVSFHFAEGDLAVVASYEVSEDGTELTLQAWISSRESVGTARVLSEDDATVTVEVKSHERFLPIPADPFAKLMTTTVKLERPLGDRAVFANGRELHVTGMAGQGSFAVPDAYTVSADGTTVRVHVTLDVGETLERYPGAQRVEQGVRRVELIWEVDHYFGPADRVPAASDVWIDVALDLPLGERALVAGGVDVTDRLVADDASG